METKISIIEPDTALADVKISEMVELLSELENINVVSGNTPSKNGKLSRIGILEVIATFITSAAAYQLASALRDFVKKQSVDIKLESPEGGNFIISAKSGDPQSLSDIVGFIMKQHKKDTKSLTQVESTKTKKMKKSIKRDG